MDLNLTLFGQMITFAIFVFVTMKYVWPPMQTALNERRVKIAEGLEAAERGKHELELAQQHIAQQLRDTKLDARKILDEANTRAQKIIDEGKDTARSEGKRLIEVARGEIAQEYQGAREKLLNEVSAIAMQGMQQVLANGVDSSANNKLIDQFVADLQESN